MSIISGKNRVDEARFFTADGAGNLIVPLGT